MLSGRWSVRSFVSADIPQLKNQQQRRQQPQCTPRCVRRERTRTRRETPHTLPLRTCESTSTTHNERQRWRRCVSSRPSVRSVLRSLPLCGTERRCALSRTRHERVYLAPSRASLPRSLPSLRLLYFSLFLSRTARPSIYELPELGRTREKPTLGLALRTHELYIPTHDPSAPPDRGPTSYKSRSENELLDY